LKDFDMMKLISDLNEVGKMAMITWPEFFGFAYAMWFIHAEQAFRSFM
jgi:hypothetical protein